VNNLQVFVALVIVGIVICLIIHWFIRGLYYFRCECGYETSDPEKAIAHIQSKHQIKL